MKTFESYQLPGYGPPTPVPIFQWEKEFRVALELYRRVQPESVLEIGTYHGGTLFHWLQNATAGTRVVSVDSYAVGVDNRHLYDDWVPQTVKLEVIVGNSHAEGTVSAVEEFAPYDWAHIDAGHYYHEVQADWNLYRPMMEPGAVVLFHDILPPTPQHPEIEVAQLWAEIKDEYPCLEIVADQEAEWGGIGVVLL